MPELGEIKRDIELGKPSNRLRYIWAACSKCGIPRWVHFVHGKPRNELCDHCRRWKSNGRIITSQGYVAVKLNTNDLYYPMIGKDGYVLEHRLIMAQSLGKCLEESELVHHKNEVKTDNRRENLELTDRSEHPKIHELCPHRTGRPAKVYAGG
jgi:hypothetical protein